MKVYTLYGLWRFLEDLRSEANASVVIEIDGQQHDVEVIYDDRDRSLSPRLIFKVARR